MMKLSSDFRAKVMLFIAGVTGIYIFKQNAKSQGKTESKVTEQAKELINQDKVIIANAKANEIEERNGKLSNRDLYGGLREFARKDD